MYFSKTLYALRLFQRLFSEVVTPYMKSKGLTTDDLHFTFYRGREFLVNDGTHNEPKTVIEISPGSDSYYVKVLDDDFKDLGEELRDKLADQENQNKHKSF